MLRTILHRDWVKVIPQIVFVGIILLLHSCSALPAVDIRTDYLKGEIGEEDFEKGKALILEMEAAYGGRENWLAHKKARFIQKADWYGRKAIAHWDTLPQLFELRTELGVENCELTLLKGPNEGTIWGIENEETYTINPEGQRVIVKNKGYGDKLLFKNYWFQFPFRIGEAEIICYAGESKIEGENYDLVYATWGSFEANKNFDQFVLYLHKESHLVEYLHFTVREKLPAVSLTAKFADFRTVDDLLLPYSQFVRRGPPLQKGMKLHENHYEQILFGEEAD